MHKTAEPVRLQYGERIFEVPFESLEGLDLGVDYQALCRDCAWHGNLRINERNRPAWDERSPSNGCAYQSDVVSLVDKETWGNCAYIDRQLSTAISAGRLDEYEITSPEQPDSRAGSRD